MHKLKSRNGQVGLLVLLATIVVMTIAVALASRTASEIAISTNEEQSTSAFESAETIIERILGNPTPPPVNMSGSIGSETYQVETVYTTKLDTDTKSAGETVEVNLQGYSDSNIKVSWQGGNGASCQTDATAIVAAVFYKDGANYRVKRSAFDPCEARKISNGFDGAVNFEDGRPTANITTQQGAWTPVSARIKLLYADSNLSVSAGSGLPPQGREITSRASSLDDQSRAIKVTEGHPMAPSIFDYAVYSAGTIENVGP